MKNAKVASPTSLQKAKMQMGVQVLVTDPKELERIRQEELEITARGEDDPRRRRERDLCSKGIDDMALKYFVEAGAIACASPGDLRRVAKATGATILLTWRTWRAARRSTSAGNVRGGVRGARVGRQHDRPQGLRQHAGVHGDSRRERLHAGRGGPLLHDALCIVKRTLESQNVVAGGGAVEAALSVYLETLATTLGSREQLAIAEFAESLLVIPKVLAVNAAKDSTELVAKLRAYHHAAQTKPEKAHLAGYGLDLVKELKDNIADGVLEPAMSKVKSIQFATEAAITILRIDDLIKLHPEEEQQ